MNTVQSSSKEKEEESKSKEEEWESKKIWNGRNDWIRTSDPYSPRVVRYQAALRSADQIVIKGIYSKANPYFQFRLFFAVSCLDIKVLDIHK